MNRESAKGPTWSFQVGFFVSSAFSGYLIDALAFLPATLRSRVVAGPYFYAPLSQITA